VPIDDNSIGVRAKTSEQHRSKFFDYDIVHANRSVPCSREGKIDMSSRIKGSLEQLSLAVEVQRCSTREPISPKLGGHPVQDEFNAHRRT
jgi:hypothetical protein